MTRALSAAALVVATMSCGRVTEPDPPGPAVVGVSGGQDQAAEAGTALGQPVSVTLLDSAGLPMAGREIAFTVTAGGGALLPSTVTTAADGVASAVWTLGTVAADSQRAEARLVGSTLPAAVFRAAARPGAPAALARMSGDGQAGVAGTPLADSLVVRVTDAHGNPVPGATVRWTVTAGGGAADPAQSATDAAGSARTRWTLGPVSTAHTITAGVGTLPPVSFSATAVVPVARLQVAASGFTLVSDRRYGATSGDTARVTARVEDAAGQPVAGCPVAWLSTAPAIARVTADGLVTALAAGTAYVVGSCAGVRDSVRLDVAPRPVRALLLAGRAERGLALQASFTQDGAPYAPASLVLRVQPADAATVSGTTLRLLHEGALVVTAIVDGDTLARTVDVAAPPAIVFDAIAAGNRDVYRVALDGAQLARLTTAAGEDAQPTAAGGTVVFVSLRDGNAELYSIAIGGTGERRLTTTSAVNERLPALSADGRLLAFVKDSARGTRVWRSGDLGATAAIVTTGTAAGVLETSPAWTPAADRLVLVSTATTSGSAGLFVVPAGGGVPAAVATAGVQGPEVEPSVSPDGARVAFAASRNGANGLYARDVATGALTVLLEGTSSLGQPSWLPDGRIVYVRFTPTGSALEWIDPAAPLDVHVIAIAGVTAPLHPAPARVTP